MRNIEQSNQNLELITGLAQKAMMYHELIRGSVYLTEEKKDYLYRTVMQYLSVNKNHPDWEVGDYVHELAARSEQDLRNEAQIIGKDRKNVQEYYESLRRDGKHPTLQESLAQGDVELAEFIYQVSTDN